MISHDSSVRPEVVAAAEFHHRRWGRIETAMRGLWVVAPFHGFSWKCPHFTTVINHHQLSSTIINYNQLSKGHRWQCWFPSWTGWSETLGTVQLCKTICRLQLHGGVSALELRTWPRSLVESMPWRQNDDTWTFIIFPMPPQIWEIFGFDPPSNTFACNSAEPWV